MLICRAWAACGLTCYVKLVVAQGIRISTKLKNIDCITGILNILKFFRKAVISLLLRAIADFVTSTGRHTDAGATG